MSVDVLGAARFAPYVHYSVLFLVIFALPWELGLKNWKWLQATVAKKIRYAWYAHGLLTFSIMYACEPQNLRAMFSSMEVAILVKYVLLSILTVILWDFFVKHDMPWYDQVLLNCHHVGLFIAINFGGPWNLQNQWTSPGASTHILPDPINATILEQQAHLDSKLFGWMWLIHAFGLLMKILKLLGFEYQEGEKSRVVEVIQHIYSAVTVYLYHEYLNAPSQPGLGFGKVSFFGIDFTHGCRNYQSYALCTMVMGRMIVNGNFKNVPFLRRVEFPGFIIVLIDQVCGFQDKYLSRAAGVFLAVCLCLLTHSIFFKKVSPRPEKYVTAEHNPELKQFLNAKKDALMEYASASNNQSWVQNWWKNMQSKDKQSMADKWPVFTAIIDDNIPELTKLLDNAGDLANLVCTDWYDSTPLGWAAVLGYTHRSAFILLEHGANPYLIDSSGNGPIDGGLKDTFGKNGKPGKLGNCEKFWHEFNEICVRQSPPKVKWNDLTMLEKLCSVAREL